MSFTQKAAFDLLRQAFERDRLAHAYLITGPAGSGKRELAANLAALVNGMDARGDEALKHPDVHVAEPESKSRRIVIEQVRELEKELQMRSMLGGKKVGILFDADRLKVEAANAFLKTLEEPPNHSLLLLTTTQPEALPDTIISRCISVSLSSTGKREPTPAETRLLNILRANTDRSGGVAPAFGMVREFIVLLQQAREAIVAESDAQQEEEEKRYKQTTDGEWLKDREEHFKALTESRYVQERFRLVAVLLNWWTDALRQQNGNAHLEYPDFAADTAKVAARDTTGVLLKKVGAIEELRENLDRNVQEQLAIEAAFLRTFAHP